MGPRLWWLFGPAFVAVLGTAYAVCNALVNPYPTAPVGALITVPSDVGVTRFLDVVITPSRDWLSPHITSVTAVGRSPSLRVRFVTTTLDQAVMTSSGFPLRCAYGRTRAAAGTHLDTHTATVLRIIIEPTRLGRARFRGFTISWRAGPFHGTSFSPFAVAVHARASAYDGCR
ncbi:MAG: hypothetical protein JO222_00190 [Frankiales bacterium]|nr:hypothetical protein [Frankiales bacterium]